MFDKIWAETGQSWIKIGFRSCLLMLDKCVLYKRDTKQVEATAASILHCS